MSTHVAASSERVWAVIEREKRRDRLIRRVSVCGWAVSGTAATVLGAATGVEVWRMVQLAMQGLVRWPEVAASAMPAVAAVGGLGLLVGTLGTVGIFLRLRTASLSEIQLRLGALEEMVASRLELHDQ